MARILRNHNSPKSAGREESAASGMCIRWLEIFSCQEKQDARLWHLRQVGLSQQTQTVAEVPLDLHSHTLSWGLCCARSGPDPDMPPQYSFSQRTQAAIAIANEIQAQEQAGGVGVALTQSSVE